MEKNAKFAASVFVLKKMGRLYREFCPSALMAPSD